VAQQPARGFGMPTRPRPADDRGQQEELEHEHVVPYRLLAVPGILAAG